MADAPAIDIRTATADDARFLAWVMLAATRSHLATGVWDYLTGWDEPRLLDFLTDLAVSEPEHLFTYPRFLVAEVDGQPAAALSGYRPERNGFSVYLPVFGQMISERADPEEAEAIFGRGEVVLAVSYDVPPNSWVIESVATAPEFRRLGLVDRLLQEVLAIGKSEGCSRAVIDTVLIGNEPALAAYHKRGFVTVDQKRDDRWLEAFGAPGVEILTQPL